MNLHKNLELIRLIVSEMFEPTLIFLDLTNITGDPKITMAKLPTTMTVLQLKRRMMFVLSQMGLPYGSLAYYQRGKLLFNHTMLGDLPQGTITCILLKHALHSIPEIKSSIHCNYCGQEYYDAIYDKCKQCTGTL